METTNPPTAPQPNSVMSKITLTNQQTCLLLRLPTELRNMIYTYVGLATIIRPCRSKTSKPTNRAPIKYNLRLPGLLSVSQQIRQEATPLLYKHALFDFDVSELCAWPPISTCNHKISEFVTSIRITKSLAINISARIAKARDLGALKYSNYRLPNLKKMYVGQVETRRPWEGIARMRLRVWCGKGDGGFVRWAMGRGREVLDLKRTD